MKRLEQRAAVYCRQVAKKLPFSGERKRAYLDNLRNDVLGYLSSHPWADLDELAAQFGTPEAIAVAFVSEMSYEEINKRFRARNRVVKLVLLALGIALAALAAMIVYLIIRNRQDMDGHFIVTAADCLFRRWQI